MTGLPCIVDFFLALVRINTQSKNGVETHPSTPGQLIALAYIRSHMEGLELDCWQGAHGTLIVKIPASAGCEAFPPVGWAAHFDTAPAASGNVNPIIHDYVSGDLALPNEGVVIPEDSPILRRLAADGGGEIITSDGTSLLGADDKAGCAAMIEMAYRLVEEDIPHPETWLLFVPDEEIGEFGGDLPPELMQRLGVFITVDGTTTGTLDKGSARLRRTYVTLGSSEVPTTFQRQVTFTFKGMAGHPGVNPELWHPALPAACHAAILIKEILAEGAELCVLTGKADEAELIIATDYEGQRSAEEIIKNTILLEHPEVSFQMEVAGTLTFLNSCPHLLSAAELLMGVHMDYPVTTYRGAQGKGYIVPSEIRFADGKSIVTLGTADITWEDSEIMNREIDGRLEAYVADLPEGVNCAVKSIVICESIADAIAARPEVLTPLIRAMQEEGIEVELRDVSGGTDGGMNNLIYPLLPSPNIFTGAEMIHSSMEHLAVRDLISLGGVLVRASRYYATGATE